MVTELLSFLRLTRTFHAAITAKDREIAKLKAMLKQAGTKVPTGRPVAATEAQQEEIRTLRKAGLSLRKIARATNLGLGTVTTVLGKSRP
jgi:DNA invertase Pin-like site-specific DNA recombinase